jgi:hypothetical protein
MSNIHAGRDINDPTVSIYTGTIRQIDFSLLIIDTPNSHPASVLPPSVIRSTRPLPNPPAKLATALASAICPDLGILPKANRAWRETHGATWYTRHYSTTLPSHWAKLTLGHNLLLALSYHLRTGLKRVGPVTAVDPRPTLHVAAMCPPFPQTGGALSRLSLRLSTLLGPESSVWLFLPRDSAVYLYFVSLFSSP